MTQEEFGQKFGIGTQGMVWQYLNGWSPLNFEAAAKFAKGLNCTIADISPPMARALRLEILPVLGRAAVIAIFAFGQLLLLTQGDARYAIAHSPADGWPVCVLCKIVRLVFAHILRLFIPLFRPSVSVFRLSNC